jgi:hypothetical protein
MPLSITTFSIMTFSILTLGITTLSIMTLSITIIKRNTQHNDLMVTPIFYMVSITIKSAMLSIVVLNVIMLIVVAPFRGL